MIHVNRPGSPSILGDKHTPAARERKKADAFFSRKRAANEKSFAFKVYSSAEVKAALERAFHGKCAYCESRYVGTQPMDVEHWRPKGKVREEDGSEAGGYYWLASTWENLLPSCIDCNRQRTQIEMPDGTTRSLGKGMWFPLEKGSKRAATRGEEDAERTLLLDPTRDLPDEYFSFAEKEGVIRPSDTSKANKALASIKVYALNRVGLVQERQRVIRLVERRIATIDGLTLALDRVSRLRSKDERKRLVAMIEDLLFQEMTELRALTAREQPYALLARQLVDAFERRLRRDVRRERRRPGG